MSEFQAKEVMMDVPQEVFDAAKTLHHFFATRGIDRWEFMDVCSRKLLFDVREGKTTSNPRNN